jgi:hypothetical protein
MMSAAMAKHVKWKRSTASFNTAAGQYETKHMAKVLFTLPEFSESKILHWEFHLDPEKESQGTGYDMIIGRDLMQALGVIIDYKTLTVSWEDIRIGMRDFFADSKNYRELHTIMQQSTEPPSVKEQTGRTVRILDAKYEAADLRKICLEQAVHLSLEERQKLLNLLTEYESLFDGTLGDWGEDEAVDLELQPDAKPHHDRPYRIPQVHRETFRKELERLCQIGVMRRRQ